MAQTLINSDGLAAGCITRAKLNTTTAASAVVAKLIQGNGISLTNTGVDAGTGDVTITATMQKYPFNFGDGSTLAFTLTHNIGSLFYSFDAWYAATGVEPDCDVTHGLNAVTVTFQVAPTSLQMSGVVIG